MLFDNPVPKVEKFLAVMKDTGARPEFECFDVGIVRSIQLFKDTGLAPEHPEVNFVMGVASGMPVDARLLELLKDYAPDDALWQTTLIGRQEIWPVHRRTAELGGNLRTGVEDTFYLPNGKSAEATGTDRGLSRHSQRSGPRDRITGGSPRAASSQLSQSQGIDNW